MMAISILPFVNLSLNDVVALLHDRNGTLPEYTYWKYGDQSQGYGQGVLAIADGKPVGCFGLIVRKLKLTNEQEISCGWFADWYVLPEMQGKGIGVQLLQAVREACPVVLGHPGPDAAQVLCRRQGFCPLAFHSRRRMVLRPYTYERSQTRILPKTLAGLAVRSYLHWQARQEKSTPLGTQIRNIAAFTQPHEFGQWIIEQPTRSSVSRTFGQWQMSSASVHYMDIEQFKMKWRRILYTEGIGRFDVAEWGRFMQAARNAGCVYTELFTTEPALDRAWASLGAWKHSESPVVAHGLPSDATPLALHGWDRENWTYLAAIK